MEVPNVYASFFELLSNIYPVSNELQQAMVGISKIVEVPKKTMLLEKDKPCDHMFYIVSGCARVFYYGSSGEEINAIFQFENDILISVYSYFTGTPGRRCIETLEDCTLISIPKAELEKLYYKFVELNFIGRKLTEFYYVRNEEQTTNLRSLSAKERYEELVESNPGLLQRVSLGHIASYLGISQETLSRIRKKM